MNVKHASNTMKVFLNGGAAEPLCVLLAAYAYEVRECNDVDGCLERYEPSGEIALRSVLRSSKFGLHDQVSYHYGPFQVR